MKYIKIISFILLNFGLFAQNSYSQSPPVFTGETTGNILWQYQFVPSALTLSTTADGSYQLISAHITGVPVNSRFTTSGGDRITALRVLDTVSTNTLNTIFPVAVFHIADDNILFKYSDASFTFANIDIDNTTTAIVVLRNAGNARLAIPDGFAYLVTQATLVSSTLSSISIRRNDPIRNDEVKWQLRQDQAPPIQGDTLKFAEKKYDALASYLSPGDTATFKVDIRPTVVGLKRDTLDFNYADGLQSQTVTIPMSVLATWTLKYGISNIRKVRPTTPSMAGDFTDTVYVSNNKDDRTRITSVRLGINFNPKNVKITSFEPKSGIFPAGWTMNIVNLDSTEKYGKIYFQAEAVINKTLNDTATSPKSLIYFKKATSGNREILGYIHGIQLLGTSDTTDFVIDTSYSRHNYSTDFVFPADTDNVSYDVPFLIQDTTGMWKHVSDNLIFQNQLFLNPIDISAKISNVYPNPASKDNIEIDFDTFKASVKYEFKIIDVVTGQQLKSTDKMTSSKIGQNAFQISIADLQSGNYMLVMTTDSNSDVWLINIIK